MSPTRPHGSPPNRRRFPRLQVLGLVDGYLMPLDVPLTVIELSTGGFSVRGSTAFPPGARHHFRFTTGQDREVTIDATAVHCRLVQADAPGTLAYVTGFEFASNARNDEAVAVLIDTLSSVFSLE
jgi:hypothetical protein